MAIAFPYDLAVNFEDGTDDDINSTEVDSGARLNIRNYSYLAKHGKSMPFKGAYAAEVDFGISTADSYFVDTGNHALNAAFYYRFMLYLSSDLTMTDDTEFSVFGLVASGTSQLSIMVGRTTTGETNQSFYIGAGKASTAAANRLTISQAGWHTVEIAANIDEGTQDDGDVTLWLDGGAAATLSTIGQIAVTDKRLGADASDAGWDTPTAGYMLLDEFVEEDANTVSIPTTERYPERLFMHETGHAFVGPGWIDEAQLLPSAAGTTDGFTIYDTDVHEVLDPTNIVARILQDAAIDSTVSSDDPIHVKRGAYVVMAGTADADGPWALLKVRPKYRSEGAIAQYGRQR